MVYNNIIHRLFIHQIGINMKGRKELSYSQKFLIKFLYVCSIWVSVSYILAVFDKNTNEAVTIAIITSLAMSVLGYLAKSFKEKDSRNKYEVDENGHPYNLERGEHNDRLETEIIEQEILGGVDGLYNRTTHTVQSRPTDD